MANVFTKKYHRPRATTLRDYGGQDPQQVITLPQIRSPTRLGNPHPQGLIYQKYKGKTSYSIWNPKPNRNVQSMKVMFAHLQRVNFSCGPVVISPKKRGVPPDIRYTVNTTSRSSYTDPGSFPHLQANMKTTRYGYKPQTRPTRGIVPNVKPPEYRAVE